MRKLGETHSEGFTAEIIEENDGRVWFKGDLDIDADGANGQHGKIAAYMKGDKGSEFLANGGMKMQGGNVRGASDWWKDIVFQFGGEPLTLPNGVVPSKTAYQLPPADGLDEYARQIDAETIPYIVVPPLIISSVAGIVKGCRAGCTYRGKFVAGIVADVGPRTKVGEASIAMARLLGIPSSPKSGGIDKPEVLYELWPGIHGDIDGHKIALLDSHGQYHAPA